jgi:hypothetical protein
VRRYGNRRAGDGRAVRPDRGGRVIALLDLPLPSPPRKAPV